MIDGGLEIPEVEFDTEFEISSLGIREGFIQRKKENYKARFPPESLDVGILAVRDGVDEEAQGMLRKQVSIASGDSTRKTLHRLSEITGATIVDLSKLLKVCTSDIVIHGKNVKYRGVHYLHIFSNYGRGRTLLVRGSTSALRDEVIRTSMMHLESQ